MASETDKAAGLRAATPLGFSHIVLNVRNLEESHQFWTGILGFRQTGEWRPRTHPPRKMRFYSGVRQGHTNHHDLALVEMPGLPPPPKWNLDHSPLAINHIAIMLPDRETWLGQVEFMRSKGVEFHRRINHGMTHSVYISDPNGYGVEVLYELPREVWQGDVNEALNYIEALPLEGEAALADSTDYPVFGKS